MHISLATKSLLIRQTTSSLAVLDRPLDAGRDDAAQRKVAGVVAHPVSDGSRLAMFQTVDDRSRHLVVLSGATDERVERHVFALALVHVERMNVELGEDVDAVAVDQD